MPGATADVFTSPRLARCRTASSPHRPSIFFGSLESLRAKRRCARRLRISGHSQIASRTRWSRGAIDALAEFRLARWDIAASEVIVEEAGGRALVWEATHAPGKYDCVIGSVSAVDSVAAIVRPGT